MKISQFLRVAQEGLTPQEALRIVQEATKGLGKVLVISRPDLAKKYGVQTATQVEVRSEPAKWPSRMPTKHFPLVQFFIDRIKDQLVVQAVLVPVSFSGNSKPQKLLGYTPFKSPQEVARKIKEIVSTHGFESTSY